MVDKEKIIEDLKTYFLLDSIRSDVGYDFAPDGKLNVHADVRPRLYEFPNSKLPFSFGKVNGAFNVRDCNLISLEGCPREVTRECWVNNNRIQSLEGAPEIVGAFFDCRNTWIKSLVGAPRKVSGNFICTDNFRLESLAGFPEEVKAVFITYKKDLPLLRCLLAQEGVVFLTSQGRQGQDAEQVEAIINRYAGQGRAGAIDCKRELVAAGFESNARW